MNGHMEKDIAISASEAAQPHINNLKIDTSPGSNDGDESPLEDENEKDVAANGELEAKPKSPSEDEATSPGGLKNYFRIFRFSSRLDWLLYGIAFVCEIGAGAALPLMTLIFGRFTTTFNNFALGLAPPGEFTSAVNQLALYFVYLSIARFAVIYVATFVINIAAIRTTRSLRIAFLDHTLRQEVWHFDRETNGSTATQVTTNGNRVNQGIAEKLGLLVQGLALFISSFVVALSVQWELALIVMTAIPAIFLLGGVSISIIAANESKITRIYSSAAVTAQDAISSIRTIHAFSAQKKIVDRYDAKLNEARLLGHKQSPLFGALYAGQNFILMSATALAFWQGYRMYRSGQIAEVGTVLTVVLSVTLGATSMMTIAPQLQAITNAASAASELFSVIDKDSQLDPLNPNGLTPSSCHGQIEVRNLSFAYPSRPSAKVLRNLSLHVPAGKTTALVGASGCGKSTLIGLLERWYQPSGGQILLDGVDLTSYNTKWLRSHVRLVQQEPVLFSGTVYQNVIKGLIGAQRDLVDEEKMKLVEEACRMSNAHDFIEELPEGYHTQVGERASMLSGGQKQRIAIARSIISDPKILLLDEATSALDPRAEKVVQDALNRVSTNKTTLIIAHKLATVKKADNIAVMSHGEVVEQGTHSELIARGGQYAAMVTSQNLGDEEGEAKLDADSDEDEDVATSHAQRLALRRTKTETASVGENKELKHLVSETLNHSLLRSILIMCREQKDQYLYFFISFIASLIAGGIYPAQAIIFSRLINVFTILDGSGQSEANFWALMFFVLAIAGFIAYFSIGYLSSEISQVVIRRYRKEMIERILHFDQDFFDRAENSSGALTSKLSSMPTALQELFSANLILMVVVLVNVVASSTLGIAYGWKLGLVIVFGGMPLLVASGYYRIHLEQKLEEVAGSRFADTAGIATEAVTSIRTVSSLTLEGPIMQEYSGALDGIVRNSIKGLILTLIPYALSQSLEFCIQALGFWYGSRLLASGEYTTSQFFTIFIAVIFGGQAAGEFFGYTTSITKAKVAANYILWLRTIEARIRESPENKGVGPSGDGPIAIDNVEFRYRQRHAARVLRGVDMKIESGTYAAFVGPSGCGKSTLIALLERFYDPTSGSISLNGDDVSTMSPHLYRNHMSLVQQEPPLYQSSVKENIALGLDYEPSDEELQEACRQSNAWEFISSLPEGLSTSCGSKGLQFSGGQRQRIAVARALIRKPRLLLLDEATSALDTQSERIVQKALDEAASSRTTIAVAHRLSTIRHADVIFVLADGKIVEQGTHEELQSLKGRYYAMCLAQSLDQDQS